MKHIQLFVIASALLFSACGSSGQQGGPGGWGAAVTPSVEAVQASYGSLPLEERLSGIVRAKNQIEVYPRVSAPIEKIYVNSGDVVKEGDPLVQLRDVELRERVRQAEANHRISQAREKQAQAALDEVESRIKRVRVLAERNLSSELELENLEAQYASAEANLELARAQVEQSLASLEEQRYLLGQTTIRAAISGTVGQRNAEVGMQVSPSTRLFVLGDLEEGIISVNLTERMLAYIQEGQRVNIYSELFPDTVLTAELTRISPFLRGASFSTEAEIDIPNIGNLLIPGMFVTVDILYGESEQATLVPLSAIYQHPRTGVTGIYRAPDYGLEVEPATPSDNVNEIPLSDPTRMEFVPIQIVAKGRESAGVTGLNSGDWVVTIGQNLLIGNENQARVRPVKWSRILDMQQLRAEDLIDQIIVKQNSN
jgi:RND family efflux transporter MFP subunit